MVFDLHCNLTIHHDTYISRNKHFYSVEYIDHDGDPVIEHGFMTISEAKCLIERFSSHGVMASVNKLSL